jgi:sulfide:quinone oxidoreductase
MPYDLFLGIPKHRVPEVVAASGMTVDGWIPVDTKTLATRFPNVYAIGDVNSVGTPKAGVFAEGAARTVAAQILAQAHGGEKPAAYRGVGTCYVEFGAEGVGKVEVEFLAGPPTGSYTEASMELAKEKGLFGSSRRAKWFGL